MIKETSDFAYSIDQNKLLELIYGLPQPMTRVDCAPLVSKIGLSARLLVRIQLSLIAISGSPGRGEKSFLGCQLPGCHRPLEGWWGGEEEEERGERQGEASPPQMFHIIDYASQHSRH